MASTDLALLIPLTAIGAPMIIGLAYVILNALSQTICHWRDVSLKIRLAEQGLSSDEIERIVLVGRDGGKASSRSFAATKFQNWGQQKSSTGKPPVSAPPLKSVS